MDDNSLKATEAAIKKTRKELKLSELYARFMENELTRDERWLLLKVLKTIALSQSRLPLLVFNDKNYVDLETPEKPEAF